MRIHSDTIKRIRLIDAARAAGVTVVSFDKHGSRSRAAAYELRLTGSSARNSQGGAYKAATWDEWGMVLAYLYQIDPNMIVGAGIYLDAEHFHWATGSRFDLSNPSKVTPSEQHRQHRWQYAGSVVTGTYDLHQCQGSRGTECKAITRRLAPGVTWDRISGN